MRSLPRMDVLKESIRSEDIKRLGVFEGMLGASILAPDAETLELSKAVGFLDSKSLVRLMTFNGIREVLDALRVERGRMSGCSIMSDCQYTVE